MRTISEKSALRAAFKKNQLLPMLTSEMIVRPNCTATTSAIWPRTDTAKTTRLNTTRAATARLSQPLAQESTAERALFGLLMLSAVLCVSQMLATMIELAPNWPLFSAWMARLLGQSGGL